MDTTNIFTCIIRWGYIHQNKEVAYYCAEVLECQREERLMYFVRFRVRVLTLDFSV